MESRHVVARITRHNEGRDPAMLPRKYAALRKDPFLFLRGTCHLFYEDWPKGGPLDDAPAAWICGDLHAGNFGTYKGDNRAVYFDLNDFDEAALGPCTWDVTRLATSLIVGARTLGVSAADAKALAAHLVDAYAAELAEGYPLLLDRRDAAGMVADLMDAAEKRKRAEFLDKRCDVKKGRRRLRLDEVRATAVSAEERAVVSAVVASLAGSEGVKGMEAPRFFDVIDVARRIAGTGSLGVRRYVIVVEGRGSPDDNFLLDLKEANASALEPYLPVPQPAWESPAHRVVEVQRKMLGRRPALLRALTVEGRPFVLKELQPTQDKIAFDEHKNKPEKIREVVTIMARLTAWAELRSSGRSGSASADDLIAFGRRGAFKRPVVDYAAQYAAKVEADYAAFCAAIE